MRRFMQTFILAFQSPKKYYIHNDIFRYQDVVFNDEGAANIGNAVLSRDIGGTTTKDVSLNPAPTPVVKQEVVMVCNIENNKILSNKNLINRLLLRKRL